MIAQLIVGGIVGVLIWAACQLPTLARWLRFQYRGLRFRIAVLAARPVPEDGLPLDADEAHDFIDAARGWELPAFEPAREVWRQM